MKTELQAKQAIAGRWGFKMDPNGQMMLRLAPPGGIESINGQKMESITIRNSKGEVTSVYPIAWTTIWAEELRKEMSLFQ